MKTTIRFILLGILIQCGVCSNAQEGNIRTADGRGPEVNVQRHGVSDKIAFTVYFTNVNSFPVKLLNCDIYGNNISPVSMGRKILNQDLQPGARIAVASPMRDRLGEESILEFGIRYEVFPEKPKDKSKTTAAKPEELGNKIEVRIGDFDFELLKIPAGKFRMGTTGDNGDRFPPFPHDVTISRDFWLGKYPVTQGQWQAIMMENPSHFKNSGLNAPVEQVSWDAAQRFIQKLNGMQSQFIFRLPTEAEWEYAARAGTDGERYGEVDAIAWHDGNSGDSTHPVGLKQPNAFGLYDMLGNVHQWCQDWFGENYYRESPDTDPPGPTEGKFRVLRGTPWGYYPSSTRVYLRSWSEPSNPGVGRGLGWLGLRLAATAAQAQKGGKADTKKTKTIERQESPTPASTSQDPRAGKKSADRGEGVTAGPKKAKAVESQEPPTPVLIGGLKVLVNVPGAKVYVDGALKGSASPRAPLTLKGLPVGRVMVKVEAPGYLTDETAFEIQEGKWTQSKVVLGKQVVERLPSTNPAWRKEEGGSGDRFTNSVGMVFVKIPSGSFQMGSTSSRNERPVHKVRITQTFWMGAYPVTQAQYEAVMGSAPSHFKGAGPSAPVESVSWDDAQAFCRALTAKEGGGVKYRLPTEAEWEYACRAGSKGDRYGDMDAIGWHEGNSSDTTHPVGEKQPNAFGLYDMLGNVWQWCQDWYGAYPSGGASDPTGPSSGYSRVMRGGSWYFTSTHARSAYRGEDTPGVRQFHYGFRVVSNAQTP